MNGARWVARAAAGVAFGALCAALTGCPRNGGATDAGANGGAAHEVSMTCDLASIGLGAAKPVALWKPPTGCHAPTSMGGGPLTITSEADFRERFGGDAAASGIDFDRDELVVASRMLSPAGVGDVIVDDGKTVTFVAQMRRPCPNDPHPMPMAYAVAFLLPAHADRRFAEATCSVGPTDCR